MNFSEFVPYALSSLTVLESFCYTKKLLLIPDAIFVAKRFLTLVHTLRIVLMSTVVLSEGQTIYATCASNASRNF